MKDLATEAITVPRARWSGSVAMRRPAFKRINTKTQKAKPLLNKYKKRKRFCPFSQSLLQKSKANNSLLTLHTHTASLSSTGDGCRSDPLPSYTPIKMIDNSSVRSSMPHTLTCHVHAKYEDGAAVGRDLKKKKRSACTI